MGIYRSQIQGALSRAWHSKVLNTWGVFLGRLLQMILVLPLILRKFGPEEVAVWYLFVALMGLQWLIDFGFGPTFVRLIASAGRAGNADRRGSPNPYPLPAIVAVQCRISFWLAIVATMLMATAGSWAVASPIGRLPAPSTAWWGWMIIVGGSFLSFRCSYFSSLLQGLDHIAVQRRMEALIALFGVAANGLVLLLGGRILALALVNQAWVLAGILANFLLVRWLVAPGALKQDSAAVPSGLMALAWGQAWRSGVGLFLATGLAQMSAVLVANFSPPVRAASFLLGFRLFQLLTQFCSAPFYTKIPEMARHCAEDNKAMLVRLAQRGMLFSHGAFLAGFAVLLLGGDVTLELVGSRTPFPAAGLLTAFGIACFLERLGAMHLQLVSVAHRIIWHTATMGFALIFIPVVWLAYPHLGETAVPLAQAAGYAGFYCWWSMRHSYSLFQLGFPRFEWTTSMPALLGLLLLIGIRWLTGW